MTNSKSQEKEVRAASTGGAGVKSAKTTNERSIGELEAEIERLKQLKKTKKNETEIKRLKSVLNKVYLEYKQKVINYEENNYTTLAFLRSTHEFYKLTEHSLLFFAFSIAPKLNLTAKIYADGDYELKSTIGIIPIQELWAICG